MKNYYLKGKVKRLIITVENPNSKEKIGETVLYDEVNNLDMDRIFHLIYELHHRLYV